MYFENCKYNDMLSICTKKYGQELGNKIYERGEEHFKQFLDEADYRGSEVIKNHMHNNIFPVLAYYMALLDLGFKKDEAYNNVTEETERYALIAKEDNKKLTRIPGSYFMFHMFAKKVMKKCFPNEGWETEWVKCDKEKVEFNLKRCIYQEVVSHYGHPELGTVFCNHDIIAFSGYLPKIKFERNATIACGNKMCDFHFINNK